MLLHKIMQHYNVITYINLNYTVARIKCDINFGTNLNFKIKTDFGLKPGAKFSWTENVATR